MATKEACLAFMLGLAGGVITAAAEETMRNVQNKRRRYNRQVRTMNAGKLLNGAEDDAPIDDTVIRTCLCRTEDQSLGMTKQSTTHQWWVNKICNSIVRIFPGLGNRVTSDSIVLTENGAKAYRAPDISIYDKGITDFHATDYFNDLRFAIEVVRNRQNFRYSRQSIEEVALDNPSLTEAFIFDFSQGAKTRWVRFDPNTGEWTNTSLSSFLRIDLEETTKLRQAYASDTDEYIRQMTERGGDKGE